MNAYTGFMQGADFIEQHPENYRFMSNGVPRDFNDNGCMWGWAAYFTGFKGPVFTYPGTSFNGKSFIGDFARTLGLVTLDLYQQSEARPSIFGYQADPKMAAKLMRRFAETKLSHLKPEEPSALDPAYIRFRRRLTLWARVRRFFRLPPKETRIEDHHHTAA